MSRLLALLAFHNEIRHLPGYFANISPHVDGIVALDDGSTDGSGEYAAAQPSVIELITLPPRTPHLLDEVRNKRLLLDAAARHDPEWVFALDADERVEIAFRTRAEDEMRRGDASGIPAFSVYQRELWNSPRTYRADGIWGAKRNARLFRFREDGELDPKALHGHWAPLNSKTGGGFPPADLMVYHLRMMDARSRRLRRERYETLDPDRRYQSIGYEYLTDETGLHLEPIAPGREYSPIGRGVADLTCVVLARGNPPSLVGAVRSLLAQEEPVEIVVVNSDGGDAAATLQREGINVPVLQFRERLFAGGARNAGITATQAPYVSFLASDCIAEPGWVAARLRMHRSGAAAVASAVTNFSRKSVAAWTSYISIYHSRMPGVPEDLALRYGASYERELFDRFGLFRDDLRAGEDTEFHERLREGGIEIAWNSSIRTAHRHPDTLKRLIGDQFRRGARTARMWHELGSFTPMYVASNALRRAPRGVRIAWNAAEAGQRRWIAAAAILTPAAALAYAAGSVAFALRKGRR